MPASSSSDRIRRVILLLIIAVPLLVGAIYAGVKPKFDASDHTPKVAVVAPEGQPESAPSTRLVDALGQMPGFSWQARTADNAAKGLNNGTLLAVVTIPDKFGSATATPESRQVTVVPGRKGDLDAATYAALVQTVSASAGTIGVNDLLVGVSKATKDLGNAQFTASTIKLAANAANDTFNGAFGTVDQLVKQAGPMMANAKSMLATIRQVSGTIDQVGTMLNAAGSAMRGINLTLGDIQNGATVVGHGADSTARALAATEPVRVQARRIIVPIADALRFSGVPDAQQMAGQLTSLLDLLGGPGDGRVSGSLNGLRTGATMIATQLNDLSGLLGAKVTANTQVADVLTLGANRVHELRAFITTGDQTITQVMGQVKQATDGLPSMAGGIKTQLDAFKNVTAQLVGQLNSGTGKLPKTKADAVAATASALGDQVLLADGTPAPGGLAADSFARAALVLLVGALLIALGRTWLTGRVSGLIASIAAGVAAVGLAGLGLAVLGSVPRGDGAFAVLVIASLALTAFAAAVLRLLGDKVGIVVWVALIGAATFVSGGLHTGHNAAARFLARLLPSSYATTGIHDAAALGLDSTVALPLAVLIAVGILSLGGILVATRSPADH